MKIYIEPMPKITARNVILWIGYMWIIALIGYCMAITPDAMQQNQNEQIRLAALSKPVVRPGYYDYQTFIKNNSKYVENGK